MDRTSAPPESSAGLRGRRAWLMGLSAVVLTGAAFYQSTGLGRFGTLAWIAPIPVLLYAVEVSSARAAALAAFAAFLAGSLNGFAYLSALMPLVPLLLVFVVPAAVFAGAVAFARVAIARLPGPFAALAFPAIWTSYEFLTSLVSPHGSAGSLAYSQASLLSVAQVASVTGLYGITFLLTLAPSAFAAAWVRRGYAPLAPALLILAAAGFGEYRLAHAPSAATLRVGLAATDVGIGAAFAAQNDLVALQVAQEYAGRVARLASAGAQVVILPEKFIGVTPADSAAVLKVFSDAARQGNVTLVAGFNRIGIEPRRNVATVFQPDGRVVLQYEKHHLLPGLESGYATGSTPGLFPAPGGKWGVAICKDMDFPAWSRAYGAEQVTLLAVPAWDFVLDAFLHSRMAFLRGIENGFTIARAAQQGELTVSDAYGRVLAERSSFTSPEAEFVVDVAPGPGPTLFTRFGNWFGWLVVTLCLAEAGAIAGSRSSAAKTQFDS